MSLLAALSASDERTLWFLLAFVAFAAAVFCAFTNRMAAAVACAFIGVLLILLA